MLLGTLTGLAVVETGLRWYSTYVQSREHIDPGFLMYDARLGWRMSPDWRGRHVNYDFDVRYATNAEGLRGMDWPAGILDNRPRFAFMGDSFTFGLGADEEDTFVALLGAADPGALYLNAGIVGYSTDQELLYLRERLESWDLRRLVLVVYLANDLLDNRLRFPLQAEMGKPLFVAAPAGLQLTNVPVPQVPKPAGEQARTLASEVLGHKPSMTWRNRWQLTRALGLADAADPTLLAGLPERLAGPVDLFVRLIAEMRKLCVARDVELTLVLLAGRSFVESPDSLSAAFQDEFRRQILARRADIRVPVLDIATPMARLYAESGNSLFHPHEGHLNRAGHEAVATLLGATIRSRPVP